MSSTATTQRLATSRISTTMTPATSDGRLSRRRAVLTATSGRRGFSFSTGSSSIRLTEAGAEGSRSCVSWSISSRAGAGLVAIKPFRLQNEAHFLDESHASERERLLLDEFPQESKKATAALRRYYRRLDFKACAQDRLHGLGRRT
jgi:hypothetical protein